MIKGITPKRAALYLNLWAKYRDKWITREEIIKVWHGYKDNMVSAIIQDFSKFGLIKFKKTRKDKRRFFYKLTSPKKVFGVDDLQLWKILLIFNTAQSWIMLFKRKNNKLKLKIYGKLH